MAVKKILILDCTSRAYNGETLRIKPLGGIETVTAHLAEHLAEIGHNITVRTGTKNHLTYNGVYWCNNNAIQTEKFDVVIANNDPCYFNSVKKHICKNTKRLLWLRNPISFGKLIKKKRLFSLLKWRPEAVFLGEYQESITSKRIPFPRRHIVPHGLHPDFQKYTTKQRLTPDQKVIFFSQSYRHLEEKIRFWMRHIHHVCPQAVFEIIAKKDDPIVARFDTEELVAHNVHILSRRPRKEVASLLTKARTMLYFGHADETFCSAAAEAIALGTPVITKGWGSLSERVEHGKTGFISKNDKQLAKHLITTLTDDTQWQRLSKNGLKTRATYDWNIIVKKWDKDIL